MRTWNELEYDTQEALKEWYNVRNINKKQKQMLTDLYEEGNFNYWECPHCGTRCLVGSPDNWNNFQGVFQSETYGELCSDCAGLYFTLKEYACE